MCSALDIPCGVRGDLDHIEAQLYRMGTAHISILRQQKYRHAPDADFLHRGRLPSCGKKSAPVKDFFHLPYCEVITFLL
jgi:hypothetical protein